MVAKDKARRLARKKAYSQAIQQARREANRQIEDEIGIYAPSSEKNIATWARFWQEYCELEGIEPREALRNCAPHEIEAFFSWYCKESSVTTASTLKTYWRTLNQVGNRWRKGQQLSLEHMAKIRAFLRKKTVPELELKTVRKPKKVMVRGDIKVFLSNLWVTGTTVFMHERERVQLAAQALGLAYTGSRPGAFLALRYKDIEMFTFEQRVWTRLTLSKLKARPDDPLTYTSYLTNELGFCLTSLIIAIALSDDAFANGFKSARDVCEAKSYIPRTPIIFRKDIRDTYIFRATSDLHGKHVSAEAQPYDSVLKNFKSVGRDCGMGNLTTYYLRRALGNLVNKDLTASDPTRNLIMNHTGTTFASHYLSTQIRYDTQAMVLNEASNTDLIDRSYQIVNSIDPHRPKKLTAEQLAQVSQATQTRIDKLYAAATSRREIQEITATRSAVRKSLADKLLKRIQAEYDEEAPVRNIERYSKGLLPAPLPINTPISYLFEERERIAAILQDTSDLSKHPEVRYAFIDNAASLCARYEEPYSRPVRQATVIPQPAAGSKSKTPSMFCQPGQCLFCMCCTALPKPKQNAFHQNLSRHAHSCWMKHYEHAAAIPCPHEKCSPLVLSNMKEFKNHAQKIHRMFLAGHGRPASERQASSG